MHAAPSYAESDALSSMNCFPAFIYERVVWPWPVQRNKYVKNISAALSSRRNRRGDDFSRTAARRPPQGTHCTSALHFSDRIRFCLYYSTSPHPTQQNFYFVALGKRTVQRSKNSRVLFGHFGYRIFRRYFPCFYTDSWEPLNQSAAALGGSFAPTCRFENFEIHKGFPQFPNLNLEQNPSLTLLRLNQRFP